MFGKYGIEDYKSLMEQRDSAVLKEMGGVENIIKELKTDSEKGICDLSTISQRKTELGANVLPDPPTKSFFRLFIEALGDLMLIILMVSAIISLILVLCFPGEDKLGWIDSVSILVAVLIVSLVQAITNWRQQRAFTNINRMKNDNLTPVVRNGERIKINATEIVVGDILYLDNGNKVAADGLFISGRDLKLNESAVTGEVLPVSISDENPFCCSGCTVENGDAYMVVIAVGPHTQTGLVFAHMAQQDADHEKTPLEEKLDYLAKIITYVGMVGALLTFIVLLVQWAIDIAKVKWEWRMLSGLVQHFIVAVTIFVCAVPEGLPLAVTISLSYSMSRMMEDNNFVRHLNACETMGGASNICSDKTGTLTTNKMTVTQFYTGLKDYDQNTLPEMPEELKKIFGIGISVNTKGSVKTDDKGILVYDGKSTECALCLYVERMGFDYIQERKNHPSIELFDFDSDRKRMTTVIDSPVNPNEKLVNCKGAPDVVLNFCTKYIDANWQVQPLNEDVKQQINDQLLAYSKKMLRSLLITYRVGGEYSTAEAAESDLIIIGIAAISDPLRPEVPKAIEDCHTAGVIVRMVTGDNIETAKAIAKECGILTADGICMTGNEFRKTPKLELLEKLPKLQVLARSMPMDKFRLVRILKEVGEVVAVTGDGTNDALALKTAHVGLSMGLCGTEIAKEASDICILDDNFKSIMMAILWGRCVFDNVRRFLQFQLTVNVSALVISFLGSCVWKESPLKPIQLLWVNLIMDTFGALALATERPREYLLHRPPYGRQVQLLNGILMTNIAGQAVYQIIVLLIILMAGDNIWKDLIQHSTQHYTLLFNSFVFCQIFNLLNSRIVAKAQKFFDGIFSNILFIIIFIGISAVQAILVEFGGKVFQTAHLTWIHWLSSLAFGIGSLLIGFFLRLIPIKELSYEAVENQRYQMYENLKETLRGLTEDEQWAQEAEQAEKERDEAEGKNEKSDSDATKQKGITQGEEKPKKAKGKDKKERSDSSSGSKKKKKKDDTPL
ncbi:Calcium-transporting ATPase 4, plasma membrane-type [Tritrichomonas foetus]|uniref:Calcium-transporting ATPase n=1 Tax=Tritrichomonas foetus TaxID=1144522 RepID=A0A1J4KEM6_9EUKA|nr:Calcium-transporting ATPase 4, plasma membrane-type [Tritrichomonas foetus]|eukprot:OHT09384.1 Calcium-transporting ATPase 4, plasma membrane-type [Tritrichomonas foetus]